MSPAYVQRQNRGGGNRPALKCDFWDKRDYDLAHILEMQIDGLAGKIGRISKNQLRNFYGEVKTLESRIEKTGARGWKEVFPLVKLMKAKVKYAHSKQSSATSVPEEFMVFIEKSVDRIKTEKEFKDFCLIFEALVGYIYGKGGAK